MGEVRKGRQTPTQSVVLPYSSTYGAEAIDIYNSTGRTAQEWQELLLSDILAVNEEGLWVHTKFGYSVPRRNGKNEIVAIREMYGLKKGERILHTAHRTTTTHSAWERLSNLLKKANIEVVSSYKAFGKEHLEVAGGGIIEFRTRTSKGGLGEGFDLLIIDEAQEYQDDQESALKYVVTDSKNPQTIFCGTPPTPVSSGTVFAKFRKATLEGQTVNSGWAEWSVPEQTDIRDNLCAKREELRADRKKMQEQQKHLSVQKDIQALKEKYQLLDKECNNKKNAFEQYEHYFNGELPEKEDVHKQIEIFDEAGRLSGKFTHIDDDDSKRLEQLRGMFEQGVPDSETIDEWQNTARQLDELKEAAAKNRLSDDELEKLEGYKKRFARAIPDENKVGKIHDIWISAQNKQNSIVGKEMKLDLARENEQARLERAKLYKNSCVPGIIAGIVMAVIGGVLVVPVMEVGIAMIIVGLCMAVVFSVIGTVKKKQHDSEFMNISAESDNKIKAIEADINDDKNFISGTENVVRQFCEEYEITFSRDNIAWELSGLCHDIEDYRELEKRAAGQDNELSEQIKQLENRLDVFLKRYNCAANGNNYSLAIERIRNDIADYKRINQEMSKQDIYRNQYEQNMSGIKCFLEKYIKSFNGEESIGETLRNLDKKLDGYYCAKSEYDNAMMIKADFESENDISMFAAQNDADKISLEDIASDMTRIDNMIEEYAQQISQCNKQLENLQIQADECENCRQELNRLTDIQESEKNKERLLKLTKQIMEDSKQSFTSEYMGPVMSGFRKYYTILTGCEPDAYNLDADTKLTVMEQNMPRDIGYLSAGKQDLVGVCMRMALVEAMYKEEKPFLIFDDPFVNLDDNNIKGAMKLLDEIAKNYQVIYFTCSESRIHN